MADRAPSPRQIAYLRYLGHQNPEALSGEENIQQAFWELDSKARNDDWFLDRLHLHPELYWQDVRIIDEILADFFKRWMTDNCPRPRARITLNRCQVVVDGLTTSDPDWWKQGNRRERFLSAFTSIFPPKSANAQNDELAKYFVGRNGENLGEMEIAEIEEAVTTGALSMEDFYFDAAINEWRPLSGLLG